MFHFCISSGSGTCVQCNVDADCPSASAAHCSSNTCMHCTASSTTQCSHLGSTPVCISSGSGTCVQCNVDADCPSTAAAHCSGNTCVACSASSTTQCSHLGSTPVCISSGSGTCVQCNTDTDCPSASAAHCSGNVCVACTASSQCTHLTPTPFCTSSTGGTCVQCISDSNCSSITKPYCSSNTCSTCTDSTQCAHFPSTPVCNAGNGGACVICVFDSDCPNSTATHCFSGNNTCVACTDSTQCSHLSSTPVCELAMGTCVECLANSDCTNPSKTLCSLSTNTCNVACTPNCLVCSTKTACKVCITGYFLLNSTYCVSSCPNGFIQNDQTQACDLCDATCQTCSVEVDKCTSCFTPYILDGSSCIPPHGNSPPTATIRSSSVDSQTFILTFSSPMSLTAETLSQNIQFSITDMNTTDYYLLNITKQSDDITFKITFNFTISIGVENLTATFTNKKVITDKNGLITNQDSVSTPTIPFTYFTPGEIAATQAITSVGSTVSTTALSSTIGMFLAGGAGGLLWAFLGLFQIINYLLYLNVNYPYNVVAFFKIFSVANVNSIIPNPIQYVDPSLYQIMQTGLSSPPKFYDNSTDALYLNNAGTTIAMWFLGGALYLFCKFMLFTFRTTGRFNKMISNFKEQFEWGLVYNAMIGTYPDLIIASCLQFRNMNFTGPIYTFSSIAALVFGACCFWAPFAVTGALESSQEVLGSKHHAKKHGALYETFKIKYDKNVSAEKAYLQRNFMAIIFLRKIAYFSGIVLAYYTPLLQLTITCGSGLALFICMIVVKPFRNKRDAWMNAGSEAVLVVIHIVIFILAGDDITLKMTDTQRKNVGWVVIFLCCLLVAYNTVFIFVAQVASFWRGFKLLAQVVCKKKKIDINKPSLDINKHSLDKAPAPVIPNSRIIRNIQFYGNNAEEEVPQRPERDLKRKINRSLRVPRNNILRNKVEPLTFEFENPNHLRIKNQRKTSPYTNLKKRR